MMIRLIWFEKSRAGLIYKSNLKKTQNIYINKKKVTLTILFEGDLKAPLSTATTRGVGEDISPFSELLHFTLDPCLIQLSVK